VGKETILKWFQASRLKITVGKGGIESASEKPLKRFRKSGEVFAVTQLKQGVNER
jgi:hypothetical protein